MFNFLADPKEFEDWRYNLLLVAPTKGEAKRTVSLGAIHLVGSSQDKFGPDAPLEYLTGYATDDILSVRAELNVIWEGGFQAADSTPDLLKAVQGRSVEGIPGYHRYSIEVSPNYDENFGRLFWDEHVDWSIMGEWDHSGRVDGTGWDSVKISPDRLRKFSLLKPQGQPILWQFGEWADRDIIRWSYGHDLDGVYVPLD